MQRKARDDWFAKHEQAVVFSVKGRLYECSSIQKIAQATALEAMRRVKEKVIDDLAGLDDYFTPYILSRRWLDTATYCEALRILPFQEPVRSAIQELRTDIRQLLYWCYIDQLCDLDVARILDLKAASTHLLFDAFAAQQRMIDAYDKLCLLLQQRFPAPNFLRGRIVEYPMVFPSPPTLTQALQPEKRV